LILPIANVEHSACQLSPPLCASDAFATYGAIQMSSD